MLSYKTSFVFLCIFLLPLFTFGQWNKKLAWGDYPSNNSPGSGMVFHPMRIFQDTLGIISNTSGELLITSDYGDSYNLVKGLPEGHTLFKGWVNDSLVYLEHNLQPIIFSLKSEEYSSILPDYNIKRIFKASESTLFAFQEQDTARLFRSSKSRNKLGTGSAP